MGKLAVVHYEEIDESSVLYEYRVFKRTKLKPAIAESNERSDLNIELIENKDGGRSVKYLQFLVDCGTANRLQPSA